MKYCDRCGDNLIRTRVGLRCNNCDTIGDIQLNSVEELMNNILSRDLELEIKVGNATVVKNLENVSCVEEDSDVKEKTIIWAREQAKVNAIAIKKQKLADLKFAIKKQKLKDIESKNIYSSGLGVNSVELRRGRNLTQMINYTERCVGKEKIRLKLLSKGDKYFEKLFLKYSEVKDSVDLNEFKNTFVQLKIDNPRCSDEFLVKLTGKVINLNE